MSHLIVFYLWMGFPPIGHSAILHKRQQVVLRIGPLGFCIFILLYIMLYSFRMVTLSCNKHLQRTHTLESLRYVHPKPQIYHNHKIVLIDIM